MSNTKMTDKQKVTTMADSDYVFGNFGGKVGQMSIPDFRSHLYDYSPDDESPELSALKSRISAVEDKNTEQDTRINAMLQEISWEGRHMNMFTETGEYHIHGERTDANDGLPILNSGTIDARLTVLDSSLTNGTGEKTDIVVTQFLRLSNRMGGDGHVYVRTAQAATKSQLATPSSTAWGTWEKLMGVFEKNAVTNIADLDTYTTNGMYSGLFADTTLQTLGGLQFTPGDTFLLITVNGYAASAFGTPQLTQMLYRLPSKPGSGNNFARMYMRTAYWDKNADPKAWVWANWDRLAMASEISVGGGGSIEEYNRLIELIAANTTKITNVERTANDAKTESAQAVSTAQKAKEAADSAKQIADTIENMSANDVSYNSSLQYNENTVGDKLSELDQKVGSISFTSESIIGEVGFDVENTASVSSINDIIIDNLTLVKDIEYKVALSIPVALNDNLLLKLCDSKGNQIQTLPRISNGQTVATATITPSNTYLGASIRLRNNITTSITVKVTYIGSMASAIDNCFQWGDVISLSSNLTDYDITSIRNYRCVTLEAPEGYSFSQLPENENTGINLYGLRKWFLLVFPNWFYNKLIKQNSGVVYILTKITNVNVDNYKNYYIGYCNYSDHTIHWERFLTEDSQLNYTKKAIVQGDSIANYMMGLIDNSNRRYSDYELINKAIAGSSIAHGGGTTPNLWKSLVDRSKTDNADYIDVSGVKKLIVWMGVNDKEHSVQFGEDGTTDETTIEGAMRVAVNNFLTVNPTLSICFVTPNNSPYHNDVNSIGKTLEDYAEEIVAVSKKLNVAYFDLFHCSCINDSNKAEIFNRSGDNIHPNNNWLVNVAADYIMKLI